MNHYNIAMFPGESAGNHPVAASTIIPTGGMVALDAAGNANPAAAAITGHVIGLSVAGVDNSAGLAAALSVEVKRGICVLQQDATNPVTKAHIGKMVYAITPDTVAYTGTCRAGLLLGFDGTSPIVDTRLAAAVATSGDVSTNAADILLLQTGAAGRPAALTVAVANTGTPNGVANVTLQAKDYLGESLAARCVLKVWFAATAYAAPADLGTLTATTGVLLKEDTDDALATVLTDANGTAVLALDLATDGTVHVMATVNGLVVTDSEAITGN